MWGYQSVGIDITQARLMEEREKEEHRLLEQIIELLPDATFVINQRGEVIFWNRAIEEMTGIAKQQMIGRGDYEYALPFYGKRRPILIDAALLSNHEYEKVQSQYDFLRDGVNTLFGEIYVPRTYGDIGAYLLGSASKFYDAAGNIIGAIESIRDITPRKRAEQEREDLLGLLQAMFDNHAAAMLLINPVTGKIDDANPAACNFYGYTKEEILKMPINDLHVLPAEEVDRQRLLAVQAEQGYFLFPHRLKNGETKLVDVCASPVPHNGETKLFSIIFDVTDRERYREQLYLEKELLRATLLSIGDGVITTDRQGRITSLNKIARQLTGWTQAEASGKPSEQVFAIVNELTRERCENPIAMVLATGNIIELANHTILISKDGPERPIEDIAAPIKDEDDQINGVVLVFRDFSEKRERQETIKYLSYHDQLTGLYNRRFYEEELKRLDTGRNLPLTLVMADINGLKLTNDAFGHLVGDKLIRKIAEIIQKECRADDILARIGGDEFVLLLPNTDAIQAVKIIQRINDAIAAVRIDNIILSVSFGLETKKDINEEIAEIFKKAEDDMYRHKLADSSSMRNKTIALIMKTLFEKNQGEEQHSQRVSQLCEEMGLA